MIEQYIRYLEAQRVQAQMRQNASHPQDHYFRGVVRGIDIALQVLRDRGPNSIFAAGVDEFYEL